MEDKILVADCAQSKASKKASSILQEFLNADIENVITMRSKKNKAVEYIEDVYDTLKSNTAALKPLNHDPSRYGELVLITDVLFNKINPRAKAYLDFCAGKLNSVIVTIIAITGLISPKNLSAIKLKEKYSLKLRGLVTLKKAELDKGIPDGLYSLIKTIKS